MKRFQNQRAKMKKIQRKQEQNSQKQDKSTDGRVKKEDGNSDETDSKGGKDSTSNKRRDSTCSTNSSAGKVEEQTKKLYQFFQIRKEMNWRKINKKK